ncbi:MAG: hydrogenase expression/formation protein [Burkholderiales bacterium]|nr:hydrogenase expression/formation protein [Burkholderiales bacterium]
MPSPSLKPFPIPLVAGPGSQEDEAPGYLPMPQGMSTYQPPPLPEPEALAAHRGCVRVLEEALAALRALAGAALPGAPTRTIDLAGLDPADRRLLNQVLGEGEVAAQVLTVPGGAAADARVRVQESVFAGVWRVLHLDADGLVRGDRLEVGAVPQPLLDAAVEDGIRPAPVTEPAPEGVMNAPSLLAELAERRRLWKPGDAPHVINLTLLPLSAGDSEHLTRQIGEGRVLILSRGYGNCRIVDTRWPRTWRVTYFNSTDMIILDTLEVCRVPEVACASLEDLEDSAERVAEVLEWVQDEERSRRG